MYFMLIILYPEVFELDLAGEFIFKCFGRIVSPYTNWITHGHNFPAAKSAGLEKQPPTPRIAKNLTSS